MSYHHHEQIIDNVPRDWSPVNRLEPTVPGRIRKRIIVCCDGTWMDGTINRQDQDTNILKLSRIINHEDNRLNPPIPQIVYYQSGIGSEKNFYSRYVEGVTGSQLGSKVEECYGFISANYQPQDEIYLFGFSRGAYTARMVAAFIGAIGILDRQQMSYFPQIFLDFQMRGKTKDPAEVAILDAKLLPWTNSNAPGKLRADCDHDSFSIKCVGVFDTVGSLGLPEEITHHPNTNLIFGFPDKKLGDHIQFAFHAMALNEQREDFDVAKFEQTPSGRSKGQILKQCWFPGAHSDIGGGYKDHDLSDLPLAWMMSNISNLLSLDYQYMFRLLAPIAPYGEAKTHDSRTGIYALGGKITRTFPVSYNEVTHELIHPSLTLQARVLPELKIRLDANPSLISAIMPWEDHVRVHWPYVPGKFHPQDHKHEVEVGVSEHKVSLKERLIQRGGEKFMEITRVDVVSDGHGPTQVFEETWITASKGHLSKFLKK